MCYLTTHHVLCPQQYGFRPGLSTEAALLDAVSYITDNIDGGGVTSLVTADTSKAFDSVEHGRLLEKLGWYGIDDRWFRAWLSDRTQMVRGGSGGKLPVTHGVVQGSILGSLLFLLFTNDLPQHVAHGKLVMYADDTQFLDAESSGNLNELKRRVEETLSAALLWFTKNRLKINPAKTDLLVLKSSRKNVNFNFTVQFGNTEVLPVQSAKILGVYLDPNLTWEHHVAMITRRCYGILIGLARMQRRIPRETKRLLVEALVFPHLQYCMCVWGSCTITQKRRLQKCLNFGARIVAGLRYRDHVSGTLSDLGWRGIGEMVSERDLCTMYKLVHDENAPELLRSRINRRSDVSSRATRAASAGHLELPRARTEFARRSFFVRAVKSWNELPESARAASTTAIFKKCIAQ